MVIFFSNDLRTPLGLQEVFDAGTASAQTGAHQGCSPFTILLLVFSLFIKEQEFLLSQAFLEPF